MNSRAHGAPDKSFAQRKSTGRIVVSRRIRVRSRSAQFVELFPNVWKTGASCFVPKGRGKEFALSQHFGAEKTNFLLGDPAEIVTQVKTTRRDSSMRRQSGRGAIATDVAIEECALTGCVSFAHDEFRPARMGAG